MYALDCIDIVVDIIDVKKSTFHVACFCTLKDSRKHPDVTQFSFPLYAQFVVLSLFSFSYHLWSTVLYIYIYIYIYRKSVYWFFHLQWSICRSRARYMLWQEWKKKKKKKETIIILSSLQACFVIAHSSGDFMVRIFVPLFMYFKNLLKNNTSIDNYLFPLFPCMHTDQTKWLINMSNYHMAR